jgi:hypothetical protein
MDGTLLKFYRTVFGTVPEMSSFRQLALLAIGVPPNGFRAICA